VKTVHHPKYSIINVRGLMLIYLLLCILAVLFSGTFLSAVLQDRNVSEPLNLIVFFTIPVVLLVFLAVSILNLFRDLIERRTGSKFQARLLAYFLIIVILAAVPVTIITSQSVNELIRFWESINVDAAINHAQRFALDAYTFHLEKLETLVRENDFDALMAAFRERPVDEDEKTEQSGKADVPDGASGVDLLPEGIAAIQDFRQKNDGTWVSRAFAGDARRRLKTPPTPQQGFVSREMPRDTDTIRYIMYPQKTVARVISYELGTGFDDAIETIENEKGRFEIIDSLRLKLPSLLIFYYGVFFFPTLLMTAIIAISFTRRVTQPIVELTEATRRVSEGDFSIQILARRGDELGLLIRSFNAMVRDLEKSRAALVKAEKISIWQSMAQQLAHEIKNPLTPIRLSAERVLRRWRNDPDGVKEILESSMMIIIQEVEGLSTLLTEFRTLARPLEPSRSWTLLRELTEETVVSYRGTYPNVRFITGHISPDISLKIDKHRLAQIITNLIINSIDAMNGQGLIEIRTDLVKKRESRYCRLSIRDTGKGITKEDGRLIFTPYFTTKESGTGLGLPIVERIVNDHGGTIWFNSAEGMGTTFFIDLPIEEPAVGGNQNDQYTNHR
jgi:nitrogen fixation/metabolism regulation signal transduction histidine kinase